MSSLAWDDGTCRDLFLWGIHDVAYIKPTEQGMHEIFSADGGRLAAPIPATRPWNACAAWILSP